MINPMQEFMQMRNMSELQALSKISLERPLTETEFQKMMKLKEDCGL